MTQYSTFRSSYGRYLHFLGYVVSALLVGAMAAKAQQQASPAGKTSLRVSPPRVLLVFDASQSMYGNIEGSRSNKLDVAKGVVNAMLADWLPEIQVGMLVYGHRGSRAPGGRCQDIEVVVPIDYDKAQAVEKVLASVQARGTTPLCKALELAAQSRPGSIVLISDGSEECGGDLLQTVHWLAAEHDDLTVHVMSLGQSDTANEALMQLSQHTEGGFFDIDRVEQTQAAFQSILNRIAQASNVQITAYKRWHDQAPTREHLTWKLYVAEPNDHGEHELLATLLSPSVALQMSPGLYWIVAEQGEKVFSRRVFVNGKDRNHERLSLASGSLTLIPNSKMALDYTVQPQLPDASAMVDRLVRRTQVHGEQAFPLEEGFYRVTVSEGEQTPWTKSVFVEAERQLKIDVSWTD